MIKLLELLNRIQNNGYNFEPNWVFSLFFFNSKNPDGLVIKLLELLRRMQNHDKMVGTQLRFSFCFYRILRTQMKNWWFSFSLHTCSAMNSSISLLCFSIWKARKWENAMEARLSDEETWLSRTNLWFLCCGMIAEGWISMNPCMSCE